VNEDLSYEKALELLDRKLKALEDGDPLAGTTR